jgi:hypothetical protein
LRLGDALDFWRVTAIEPGKRLELTAEMLLPGVAVLTLEVEQTTWDGPGSRLLLTARFWPRGLWGIVYWCVVFPFHGFIFPGMLRGLARQGSPELRGPKGPPVAPLADAAA